MNVWRRLTRWASPPPADVGRDGDDGDQPERHEHRQSYYRLADAWQQSIEQRQAGLAADLENLRLELELHESEDHADGG